MVTPPPPERQGWKPKPLLKLEPGEGIFLDVLVDTTDDVGLNLRLLWGILDTFGLQPVVSPGKWVVLRGDVVEV